MTNEARLDDTAAAEQNYVRAAALLTADQPQEAIAALRRVIYLDRSVSVAHFLMAVSLERLGNIRGAMRAFARVEAICSARPPDEAVPLSDGETAGNLAAIARGNIVRLQLAESGSYGR
jgi:chemotaxis protein methyltransferase CheR